MARMTEAQKQQAKEKQLAWKREHIKSVSCRVRTEEAEAFKAYCAEHGTSTGTLLREYVMGIIEEYKNK